MDHGGVVGGEGLAEGKEGSREVDGAGQHC